MADDKLFGRHIKAGRALLAFNQKDLAREMKALGSAVDPATISLWERGERYPSHLQFSNLCRALGWHDSTAVRMERMKLAEEARA